MAANHALTDRLETLAKTFLARTAIVQELQEKLEHALDDQQAVAEDIDYLIRPYQPTKERAILAGVFAFWLEFDQYPLKWARLIHPDNLPDHSLTEEDDR